MMWTHSTLNLGPLSIYSDSCKIRCPFTHIKLCCICIWQGVVNNKDFVQKILKEYEIDIVISAIGAESMLDQLILVEAMKSVKTIKVRFLLLYLFNGQFLILSCFFLKKTVTLKYWHTRKKNNKLCAFHFLGNFFFFVIWQLLKKKNDKYEVY